MDLTQFLTGGAATRDDSLSGLTPDFSSSLSQMFAAAPPDIQSQLGIGSGFRSPELQAKLYEDALVKYGSPEAARKWVAPPGRSNHNRGGAVDLSYLNDEARKWAHANAANFGLAFPMKHEPWHIEMAGARDGTPLSFGPSVPTGPTDVGGVAGLFGGGGLALGVPVDPFTKALSAPSEDARKARDQSDQEAAERRRIALLSDVGSMFG